MRGKLRQGLNKEVSVDMLHNVIWAHEAMVVILRCWMS